MSLSRCCNAAIALGAAQRAMLRQLIADKQKQAIQQRRRESLQLAAPNAGGHP